MCGNQKIWKLVLLNIHYKHWSGNLLCFYSDSIFPTATVKPNRYPPFVSTLVFTQLFVYFLSCLVDTQFDSIKMPKNKI